MVFLSREKSIFNENEIILTFFFAFFADQNLRQNRKKYVKAHKLIFPLLLAYKLKFFTMVPLLVGALVLLVGTTGVAGFFFALFAAAMGLHVKTHK